MTMFKVVIDHYESMSTKDEKYAQANDVRDKDELFHSCIYYLLMISE